MNQMWRVLGIDLAWGEGSVSKAPNESGVAAANADGTIVDAGWTIGIEQTLEWIRQWKSADTLLMIDAPLVVTNETGQRACERQVGRRYGRWNVSANSTNIGSPRLAGVTLLAELEKAGWLYQPGFDGPPTAGLVAAECYPYTAIVGTVELSYEDRPRYKRKPKSMSTADFRPSRTKACDDLISRLASLSTANPRFDLTSHLETARLVEEQTPSADGEYKHREDLIDASICAWTGLLWLHGGLDRCQVLGDPEESPKPATIVAPARPEQRALLVPAKAASEMDLIEFAFNYHGYEIHGELGLSRIAKAVETRWTNHGTLPTDLSRLRATLFFLQRQHRYVEDPRPFGEIPLVRALLAQIREAV